MKYWHEWTNSFPLFKGHSEDNKDTKIKIHPFLSIFISEEFWNLQIIVSFWTTRKIQPKSTIRSNPFYRLEAFTVLRMKEGRGSSLIPCWVHLLCILAHCLWSNPFRRSQVFEYLMSLFKFCLIVLHWYRIFKLNCSLKLICNNPSNPYGDTSFVIQGHAQSNEKLELPQGHVPSLGHSRQCSASCFSSFCSLCSTMFFTFLNTLCWRFCCLKWLPSIMLKYCLVFLRALEGCDMPYGKNASVREESFSHQLQWCWSWVNGYWINNVY